MIFQFSGVRIVLILFFCCCYSRTQAQELTLVCDSIMDYYMKSGYADKHFMPKGKEDKNDERQGFWKDYEVSLDITYFLIDSTPTRYKAWYLLYAEGDFKNNKREGEWTFYVIEDKTFKKIKQKTVEYIDGKEIGNYTYFFPDKSIASTGFSVNGLKERTETAYYEDGSLYGKRPFSKGKRNGLFVHYYRNQVIMEKVEYENDSLHGISLIYYPDGQLKESCKFINGKFDGVYQYYYENGQLWVERIYKNGLIQSVTGSYDMNGNARDKGTLVDGNGTVNFYTLEGKLYLIRTYENGKEVKNEEF